MQVPPAQDRVDWIKGVVAGSDVRPVSCSQIFEYQRKSPSRRNKATMSTLPPPWSSEAVREAKFSASFWPRSEKRTVAMFCAEKLHSSHSRPSGIQ